MRLDIFRRAEQGGTFSYLAVPEGRRLPNEVTNVDWEDHLRGIDPGDASDALADFHMKGVSEQIDSKGYAISSLNGRSHPVGH